MRCWGGALSRCFRDAAGSIGYGGQFRLPLVGGVIAPDQGLFPQYDAGIYSEGSTNMVVSRGLGNSIIPIRFNNRPEIVLIELNTKIKGSS